MEYVYINNCVQDFITLSNELDSYLNEIAGGEENRLQYIPFNKPDNIHDVIIAYDGKIPAGCAGFKYYEAGTAEVKRVFVRKEYRRKGVSKKLMELLEQKAKEKGYTKLILETGNDLTAAMNLYKAMGFRIIPNYGQYKGMPESVCMEKPL